MSVATIQRHLERCHQRAAAAKQEAPVLKALPQLDGPQRIRLIQALSRAHLTPFTDYDWSGWSGAEGDAQVIVWHKHDYDFLAKALGFAWWEECHFTVLDETGITFNGWEESSGFAYQVRIGFDVDVWDAERVPDSERGR